MVSSVILRGTEQSNELHTVQGMLRILREFWVCVEEFSGEMCGNSQKNYRGFYWHFSFKPDLYYEKSPGSTFATWDATCTATWETQVASLALANHVCFRLP